MSELLISTPCTFGIEARLIHLNAQLIGTMEGHVGAEGSAAGNQALTD
jgi:hypothetical protein